MTPDDDPDRCALGDACPMESDGSLARCIHIDCPRLDAALAAALPHPLATLDRALTREDLGVLARQLAAADRLLGHARASLARREHRLPPARRIELRVRLHIAQMMLDEEWRKMRCWAWAMRPCADDRSALRNRPWTHLTTMEESP